MSALAAVCSGAVAAPATHAVNHLPMPAWAFGAIALAVGLLLLVFTWLFRHTAAVMIDGPAAHHGGRGHEAPGAAGEGGPR